MSVAAITQWTFSGPVSTYSPEFALLGANLYAIPQAVVPLPLNYRLVNFKPDIISLLSLPDDGLTDFLGINDLALQQILLPRESIFSKSGGIITRGESLSFDTQVVFDLGNSSVILTGENTENGVIFHAVIPNFTLEIVNDLFLKISGEGLPTFETHILEFKAMNLVINTIGKTKTTLHGFVTLGGYQAANATITLDSNRVSIEGDISDIHVGGLTIKDAAIEVLLYKPSSNRPCEYRIHGVVDFLDLLVSVDFMFDNSQNGEFEWSVFGAIEGIMQLSKLDPLLKETPFDATLSKIALIASSDDVSGAESLQNEFGYPVKKGVQLCATVDGIGFIDELFHDHVTGLMLSAHIGAKGALSLSIIFPRERTLNIGGGLTTGPLILEIDTAPPLPKLKLRASLNVPVPGQEEPLFFEMGLILDSSSASGFAELNGYWINPLGLGTSLRIGPVLTIDIGVHYSAPSPSSLGFQGGLAIGNTEVQVAFKISDEGEELLRASVSKLPIADLVIFAEKITGIDIPNPPDDFLSFDNLQLYLSSGTFVGGVFFPAGASFEGQLTLLGEQGTLECQVGDGIKIKASFDSFPLGSLSIAGEDGSSVIADVELGPTSQTVFLSGVVDFFGFDKQAIELKVELLPEPTFEFQIAMFFSEWLIFQVEGRMLGVPSLTDLSSLDFELTASLRQDVLDHITTQSNQQFSAIQDEADRISENAHKMLDETKKKFNVLVSPAPPTMEQKQDQDTIRDRAHEKLANSIRDAKTQSEILSTYLSDARQEYDMALMIAQNEIQNIKITTAAAITLARSTLILVQQRGLLYIDAANKISCEAAERMYNRFGDPVNNVVTAKGVVDSLLRQIDSEKLASTDKSDTPGLSANLLKLESSLKTANSVLDSAKKIVQSTDYITAQALVENTRTALSAAQAEYTNSMTKHLQSLEQMKVISETAIKRAEEDLEEVKKTQGAILQAAIAAAASNRLRAVEAIKAAQSTVDVLSQNMESPKPGAQHTPLGMTLRPTRSHDIARISVELARQEAQASMDLATWARAQHTKFISIKSITLTGRLKDIVGQENSHFEARVEGVAFGKEFSLDSRFRPGETDTLVASIAKNFWDGVLVGLLRFF